VAPDFDYVDAIASHSAGFAAAASAADLDAPVPSCPAWSVADLVYHLTEVQWFWGTIVEERLCEPPPDERRPERAGPAELVPAFRAGADRLVRVLREARDEEPVWSWAPGRHDVGFVRRHQVQEAAVHHWDAENAAGRGRTLETPLAVDAISEFLTFSVSSESDPASPARPALAGTFALSCTNAPVSWIISDGQVPGTVAFARHDGLPAQDLPTISATASDLLLWLYHRVHVNAARVPIDLTHRFRHLCFTD
jgi:uncharacterized protein (TIGR03083 family)